MNEIHLASYIYVNHEPFYIRTEFVEFSNTTKVQKKPKSVHWLCTTTVIFFFLCDNRFVTKYEPVIVFTSPRAPFINLLLLLLACGERWHRNSLKIYIFMHANKWWNVNGWHTDARTHHRPHTNIWYTYPLRASPKHVLLFNVRAHLFKMHKTVSPQW